MVQGLKTGPRIKGFCVRISTFRAPASWTFHPLEGRIQGQVGSPRKLSPDLADKKIIRLHPIVPCFRLQIAQKPYHAIEGPRSRGVLPKRKHRYGGGTSKIYRMLFRSTISPSPLRSFYDVPSVSHGGVSIPLPRDCQITEYMLAQASTICYKIC